MSTFDSDLAEPAETLSDEACRAALRTVCHHATGKDDALELAKMLGLLDKPESKPRKRAPALIFNPGNCITCGAAMNRSKAPSQDGTRYGALGRCERCYAVLRRARRNGKA